MSRASNALLKAECEIGSSTGAAALSAKSSIFSNLRKPEYSNFFPLMYLRCCYQLRAHRHRRDPQEKLWVTMYAFRLAKTRVLRTVDLGNDERVLHAATE